MSESGGPSANPEQMIGVPEASELLGVPRSWVYASVESDPPRLPHYRIGRYVKFRASELEDWIQAQRQSDNGTAQHEE